MTAGFRTLAFIAVTGLASGSPVAALAQAETDRPPAVPDARPVTVERIRIDGAHLAGNLEGNSPAASPADVTSSVARDNLHGR